MAILITYDPIPTAVRGVDFSFGLGLQGDAEEPVNWTISAGALPPGFALASPTGLTNSIAASPVAADCPEGTYNFTVRAVDNATEEDSVALSIVVTRTQQPSNVLVAAVGAGLFRVPGLR